MNQQQQHQLTLIQKKELKQYKYNNPKETHESIAMHFSNEWKIRVVRSTVSGILRAEDLDDFRSPGAKRRRDIEYPKLEECLYLYYSNVRAHNIPISDAVLISQAKIFGQMLGISDFEFKYSIGWLNHFKKDMVLKIISWLVKEPVLIFS
jgi:hypothetical protein